MGSKLKDLDVLFLFQENRNPVVNSLRTTGTDILKMLPEKYEIDFSSKYRREQFAKYLAERVDLRYGVMGQNEFFYRDWVLEEVVEKHNIERENERRAFLEKQEREKKELAEEARRLKHRAERDKKVAELREAKSREGGENYPPADNSPVTDTGNDTSSHQSISMVSEDGKGTPMVGSALLDKNDDANANANANTNSNANANSNSNANTNANATATAVAPNTNIDSNSVGNSNIANQI